LNRRLREAGLIVVRDEQGREKLDAGESAAFAVADHQVAHVYIKDPSRSAQATQDRDLLTADRIHATEVHDLLLQHLGVGATMAVGRQSIP
jgi:hypothetical protein